MTFDCRDGVPAILVDDWVPRALFASLVFSMLLWLMLTQATWVSVEFEKFDNYRLEWWGSELVIS